MSPNPAPERAEKERNDQITSLSTSLPRGGCSIRSISGKFAKKQVTGTDSINIPICNRLRRSNFYPQPSFSYDPGANQHYLTENNTFRVLGIPIVVEHLIEQESNQLMRPLFEQHFSESSWGLMRLSVSV